jgi:hypothetical protein
VRRIDLRLRLDANLLKDRHEDLAKALSGLFRLPHIDNPEATLTFAGNVGQQTFNWPVGGRFHAALAASDPPHRLLITLFRQPGTLMNEYDCHRYLQVGGTAATLRASRPRDKHLAGPLETTAASEELRKRCRRKPAHRDESKEGKNRLALPHLHLRNLPHKACVPTKSRPLVLRRVTISEEQGELESFNEPDDLDLRSGG